MLNPRPLAPLVKAIRSIFPIFLVLFACTAAVTLPTTMALLVRLGSFSLLFSEDEEMASVMFAVASVEIAEAATTSEIPLTTLSLSSF